MNVKRTTSAGQYRSRSGSSVWVKPSADSSVAIDRPDFTQQVRRTFNWGKKGNSRVPLAAQILRGLKHCLPVWKRRGRPILSTGTEKTLPFFFLFGGSRLLTAFLLFPVLFGSLGQQVWQATRILCCKSRLAV